MSDYKPIQCGLYDILEDRIVRRVPCTLVFQKENEAEPQSYDGRLMNVFSQGGAEFLMLEQGKLIRLDYILKLDEIDFVGSADNNSSTCRS